MMINKVTDNVEITDIPYCEDIIVNWISSNYNGRYYWADDSNDPHVNRIWNYDEGPAIIKMETMKDNNEYIYYVLDNFGTIVSSELISAGYPPYNTNGTSLKWYDSTGNLVPDMTVVPKFDMPSTIIENNTNWSR